MRINPTTGVYSLSLLALGGIGLSDTSLWVRAPLFALVCAVQFMTLRELATVKHGERT